MGKSRNDQNRDRGGKNRKNKKGNGGEKQAKPRERYVPLPVGDPKRPDYRPKIERQVTAVAEEKSFIHNVHQIMRLPKDTQEVFVRVPDEKGNEATFSCTGGAIPNPKFGEEGQDRYIKFVEIRLDKAVPGNPLYALPESAKGVPITPGQVKAAEFTRKPHWTTRIWETKCALRKYLRSALEREPDFGEAPARQYVFSGAVLESATETTATSASSFAALLPIKEVVAVRRLEKLREESTPNVQAFLRKASGTYRFPAKGQAVFLGLAPQGSDVRVAFLGVEEGNPLHDTLKGHEVSFSYGALEGKSQLSLRVRQGNEPREVATRRLHEELQKFLVPHGLVVTAPEEVSAQRREVRRPVFKLASKDGIIVGKEAVNISASSQITVEDLKNNATGRLTFEGVSLEARSDKGMKGRTKTSVYVLSVPEMHPDAENLGRLVGTRNFIPTFVVEKYSRYPRETIHNRSEEELGAFEALWKLLRRAYGFEIEQPQPQNLLAS